MSSKPKQCETCGRDFTKMSQQAFHEHLMKHEDKEHPCTVCPKTFPSARMLRYHKLKVHCKKVVCQCCNQTFSNKYNMQSHLDKRQDLDIEVTIETKDTETDEVKQYKCNICQKKL